MPFRSGKQRRYLWANEPEIARDWTNKYGSRIRRDNGGIMHQFENYAHDDGNNVSVPRKFKARENTPEVELAYITPKEAGILAALRPGSPHRGPMEVPSYDFTDAKGRYRGSEEADYGKGTTAFGKTSVTGQGLDTQQQKIDAFNKSQWKERFTPINQRTTYQPGFFGGLKNMFGKLRGWNEKEERWNTQQEYETARTKSQWRNQINRLRKTRDIGRYANDPEGWRKSALKERLEKKEKAVFGQDYVDYSRNRLQARDLKALRDKQALTSQLSAKDFINLNQSIPASSYKPRSFMENLQSKYPGAKPAGLNPLKKDLIEYFYPSEHGDKYIGLQTGEIPTENYHRDVTADYWQNVSKNWGEIHPALGAMVNVGAPAGTMIGGLMYDLGQAYTRMEPGSGLSGYAKAVAAEQPIKSNLQRMAGSVEPLLSSWGIGNNLSYAKGGLASLWPR